VILHEIVGGEQHPVYQQLEVANGNRQYDFLQSIVSVCLAVQRPFLSSTVIKALNFQAITCLHTNAGEYRPCEVTVGTYQPPAHHRVDALMDDFVNSVNRSWEKVEPVALAALVLWRLNHIHPFINGNGRTARAACYFVLCVRVGFWLPGSTILPELLRRERDRYVEALRKADASLSTGTLDLTELHALITELLEEQINGAASAPPEQPPRAPAPPALDVPAD
jgi:prophage maintenance system killer protein